MKRICAVLALPVFLLGQASRQSYTYDLNGNLVAGPAVESTNGARTVRAQSINGGKVPLERIEERVLRSDSSGKTVERTVRRFTPDGQPLPPERILIEEEKRSDGSSTIRTSLFQADANGSARLVERSTAESGRGTTDVLIERPSVDGTLVPSERRLTVETKSAAGGTATTTILKPDTNGRFLESVRETVERQTGANGSTETSALYAGGQLLESRRSTTVKQQDGSESVVVDVYAPFSPGLANSDERQPKLREQQIIERRVENGGVVESVSVRRPGLADPDRLGPAQKVKEIRCTGKCP